MAETVTSLELFAFVVLPIGVAASAWGFILVAERRRAGQMRLAFLRLQRAGGQQLRRAPCLA